MRRSPRRPPPSPPISTAVTCAITLDKGLAVLESAQGNSDVNAHFDVALVEEEQVAPIMRDATRPGTASSPLFGRFTTMAKDVAIVLMHEDEDVASKTYMIEAIKIGVVDVVKYPLVKQSMRTLWQHAVRKIIRQQATAADVGGASGGAGKKRSSEDRGRRAGGLTADGQRRCDSGDSSASEERALKRQSNSPTTVLEDESNPSAAASGGGVKGKAVDKAGAAVGATAGNSNAKKPTSAGGAKAKPQARSTQQWKAAEQRGRRLAIKPHTAMVQGQQGSQMGGRVAYWNPGSQMMQGTTQTMTVNGQQVQVWVPMQGGSYSTPAGQQQQPGAGTQPAGVSGAQSAPSAGAGSPSAAAGTSAGAAAGPQLAGDNTQAAGSQPGQSPQQQFASSHHGGVPVGPNGQPLPMVYPQGMVLVRQANGQMVYMQATPQMMQQHQMQQQQQGQYMQFAPGPYTHGASGDSTMVGSADDKAPAGSLAGPDLNLGDVGLKGQPLPLGLNLRRTNSLENMMGGGLGNQIDANVFNDAEPMEDDALDMLLRDGGGNLFDNMDDSMLAEAAANSAGEFFGMVNA